MDNDSPPVERVASACQIWAGYASVHHDPPDRDSIANTFAGVGSPTAEVERRAIGYTLITFAVQFVAAIHRNFHHRFSSSAACGFAAPLLLPTHDSNGNLLIHESVGRWADQLRDDFISRHDSYAHRARRLLEGPAGTALSVAELASRVGMARRSLERQFLQEIGVTIAEYRTRHRVIAVVRSLREGHGKRDTMARTIGWRSKKGVYDACDKVLGITPAEIQQLSDADAGCLEAKLLDPQSPVRR